MTRPARFCLHFIRVLLLKALAKIRVLYEQPASVRPPSSAAAVKVLRLLNLFDETAFAEAFSRPPRLIVYPELYDYAECVSIFAVTAEKSFPDAWKTFRSTVVR